MSLDLTPRPGSAPVARMVLTQGLLELRLLLRHGEQLALTLLIPVGLLILLSTVEVVDIGDTGARDPVDFFVPGMMALAVVSTAFTSQAIATGFERRYGVLKRLWASPLPRWGLLAGKTLAVVAAEVVQLVVLAAVGVALGWRPHVSWLLPVLLMVVCGTAAFSALALLMAGTLRAEATLAAANVAYLVMLAVGGIVVPLDRFPDGARTVVELLPLGALSEGLREAMNGDASMPWVHVGVLLVWAFFAGILAARLFDWE